MPAAWLDRLLAHDPGPDSCVSWPYAKDSNGYPRMMVDGESAHVCRIVLAAATGDDGDGKQAAHAPSVCHNTSCVNPHHLRWASASENAADKRVDGTHNAGSHNGNAKLNEHIVRLIRADHDTGETPAALAQRYGVHPATIRMIVRRKTWQHID